VASDCASLDTNDDGRIRCSLNIVGTESGRFSSAESPAGTGRNLQNITKKIRRFFRADSDHWYAQMDLGGSDGWTVAARCHALGDPTMWDDYTFGLKPAKILMLLLRRGVVVNSWSREDIKAVRYGYLPQMLRVIRTSIYHAIQVSRSGGPGSHNA